MMLYNDIYEWEGWGGPMRLGSGKCRLRLIDLRKGSGKQLYFKPFLVIVQDVAGSPMSVRSCAGHIATTIVERFGIDPVRMTYVEYTPEKRYGSHNEHIIPGRMETVEFEWREGKAIKPVWRDIRPPLDHVVDDWLSAEKEEVEEAMGEEKVLPEGAV
uniref:Uncharacterized protein n=1 Tax=Desulfatirhabdium butyrativorans TaxID=340467 RepID=A0A7C4RQB7_9BACT